VTSPLLKSNFPFIRPSHRYLFKESVLRHPWQYWMEIIAYQIGCLAQVSVPPAYVAIDSKSNKSAALIEWFYGNNVEKNMALVFIDGGDLMTKSIPNYDLKKGKQHNFETIRDLLGKFESQKILTTHWYEQWIKILIFDALIANTDRHQNNWGIIFRGNSEQKNIQIELAPAFDNGTSMGYDILEENFKKFNPEKYFEDGTHHMKWKLSDIQNKKGMDHAVMINGLVETFPNAGHLMKEILNFDLSALRSILNHLTQFKVIHPFTEARADFVYKLIEYRKAKLLTIIEETI
jgi:hypothetical protein